jgi:hypothetical protein
VKFHCPKCRTKLKVDARFGGTTLACPQCGITLSVPQWYGSPGEFVAENDPSSTTARTVDVSPAVTLSAEEMAFLGAKQEVG